MNTEYRDWMKVNKNVIYEILDPFPPAFVLHRLIIQINVKLNRKIPKMTCSNIFRRHLSLLGYRLSARVGLEECRSRVFWDPTRITEKRAVKMVYLTKTDTIHLSK